MFMYYEAQSFMEVIYQVLIYKAVAKYRALKSNQDEKEKAKSPSTPSENDKQIHQVASKRQSEVSKFSDYFIFKSIASGLANITLIPVADVVLKSLFGNFKFLIDPLGHTHDKDSELIRYKSMYLMKSISFWKWSFYFMNFGLELAFKTLVFGGLKYMNK